MTNQQPPQAPGGRIRAALRMLAYASGGSRGHVPAGRQSPASSGMFTMPLA